MKKIKIGAILISLFFISGLTPVTAQELVEHTDRDITIMIPAGWETGDIGLLYKVIIGPVDDNLAPNITFASEDYSGYLPDYIDATINVLQSVYTELKILQRGSFSIDSRLNCSYVTITGSMGQVSVWQKMYIIHNKNKSVIMAICGTAGINSGRKYEPIFNSIVKTLKWS